MPSIGRALGHSLASWGWGGDFAGVLSGVITVSSQEAVRASKLSGSKAEARGGYAVPFDAGSWGRS